MAATTPVQPSALTLRSRGIRRAALVVLFLIVLTYGLAWYNAYNLTRTYLGDAAATFEEGDYVASLDGYEEFDETAQRDVFRGGYAQVVNIWNNPYALPKPAEVAVAQARIEEVINERLTLEDAERFVQRNSGRGHPYLGRIYLRMGELYEAEGDTRTAEDIYEEVIEFFPQEAALIERAQTHLDALAEDADT